MSGVPIKFPSTAVVILGHGTTLNADSAAPVYQHAAELRRRGLFTEVREAFWKQEPLVGQVMAELPVDRVVIVPLFVSEGYFSDQVIPRALGFWDEPSQSVCRVRRDGARTSVYTPPVGTHSRITEVLLDRARSTMEKFPFPRLPPSKEVTLVIAGHGTQKDANSRQAIERQVEAIRALGTYATVEAVYLEEEPRIDSVYRLAATRHVVVVPFFISDGLHVREDIPVLLGEPKRLVAGRLQTGQPTWRNPTEKHGKRVWYTASIGSDPLLAEVILERVQEGLRLSQT